MSTTDDLEDEKALTCPVCLQNSDDQALDAENDKVCGFRFACNPECGHCFCLPCLERLLLAPSSRNRASSSESSFTTTTLGTCPICRKKMSYFDLVYSDSKKPVFPVDGDTIDALLVGAVYVDESSPGIGWGSYHFPKSRKERNANTKDDKDDADGKPYMNLGSVPKCKSPVVVFNHSRYHALTHTWEGKAAVTTNDNIMTTEWHVLLTFSHNFQTVTQGVIIQTNRPSQDDNYNDENGSGTSGTPHRRCMDGSWRVQRLATLDLQDLQGGTWRQTGATLQVTQSSVIANRTWFRLHQSNHGLTLTNAMAEDTRVLYAVWDWASYPDGPTAVGTRLEWRTTPLEESSEDTPAPQQHFEMDWIRMSSSNGETFEVQNNKEKVEQKIVPVGGSSGRTFRKLSETTNESIVRSMYLSGYCANTFWGNTFCQAFKVGLASYHFNTNGNEAYISYEHSAVSMWPPLDSGAPVPSTIRFRNIRSPDRYTFCGHICWLEDCGTTWQGMVRWEYEMKFDSDFFCICSGCVKSFVGDRTINSASIDLGVFGRDLVYVNFGLFDEFRSNRPIARDLIQRLQQEEASTRVILMIRSILIAAQSQSGTNPISVST